MPRAAVAYLRRGDELPRPPRGLAVVHTLHESQGETLGQALAWIESGQAEVLLVARLGTAASTLGELVRLMDWLAEHQGALVALHPELDTGQPSGRLVVDVLHEIRRWFREPEAPGRGPGRPGLIAAAPEVAERIGVLRERGMSLHAIAEALNAQGVPTPRGGARWRPSSVQTALGYRRPERPVRPPPPHHHPGGPGAGGPGKRPGPGGPGRP